MIYVSRQSFPVFFYHNSLKNPPDNFFKAYIICVCLILANIESGAAAAAAAVAAAAAAAAAAALAGSSGSMEGTMPAGSVPPGLPQPGTGIFE